MSTNKQKEADKHEENKQEKARWKKMKYHEDMKEKKRWIKRNTHIQTQRKRHNRKIH